MTETQHSISDYIESLIAAKKLPGAVVCLAEKGEIRFLQAYGHAVLQPQKIPAGIDTLYDAASLTKPLVTTTIILLLIQQGKLDLNVPLSDLFPNCPPDKKEITVSDLLCHCSGIMAWYPLFTAGKNIAEYSEFLLNHALKSAVRQEVIYSCPNFVLLASIIERILRKSFMEAAVDMVIKPLSLRETFLGAPPLSQRRIAATEDSSATEREKIAEWGIEFPLREGIIWGQTHDSNSHFAGGSSGNSGLFTTVREVLFLADQYGNRSKLLNEKTRSLIPGNKTPFGPQHRTLGWQLAFSPGSSAGPALSPNAIGHTGFTGTSLWIDPEVDRTYIIFSNRIHPTASDIDMGEIRRTIHSFLANQR